MENARPEALQGKEKGCRHTAEAGLEDWLSCDVRVTEVSLTGSMTLIPITNRSMIPFHSCLETEMKDKQIIQGGIGLEVVPLCPNQSASPRCSIPLVFPLPLMSLAHTPGQTHSGLQGYGRRCPFLFGLWLTHCGRRSLSICGGLMRSLHYLGCWWAGLWVWRCPELGTGALQTPDDGLPPVKS